MRILLANPRGFCAGVNRAISIVERALEIYGEPVYVLHEIVHNSYVVNTLRQQGAIFIEQLNEVPDGTVLIFSAHGVSQSIQAKAYSRAIKVFDATCPLVTKVHMEVARASRKGTEVILIGHNGHPEVEGIIGQYHNSEGGIYLVESSDDVWRIKVKKVDKLYFMTQTTLSVNDTSDIIDALRSRFPFIMGPYKSDICYATTNRQKAVQNIVNDTDIVLVVGSKNSSNANQLVKVAKRSGNPAYLIDNASDIQETWLHNIQTIGVTAGASSPDILVQQVIDRLLSLGAKDTKELMGLEENIHFQLPKNLQIKVKLLE